ncbi:igE-binding protein-like [Perognathus longimembris pacificus]|uniref:igE-binding protein-like n=1 Tax=Perognathus longimembris pacificus TaxID=214514 RepID=UPI0020184D0E|nr:igE-binding protein-like [Perognathus longimembris pacificus]
MGASSSHPIFLALNELLHSKKLKINRSILEKFLAECDTAAPWFAVSGSLTVASWEKLGRDLDFAHEHGTLKGGVRPIWKLIRSCLDDQRCGEAVENGQAALEKLQEERSEKAASEGQGTKRGLYPDLAELDSPESTDSEEVESILEQLEEMRVRGRKARKEKKKRERDKGPPYDGAPTLSAPPPYFGGSGSRSSGSTFNPEVWRTVRTELDLACPIFQDPQGQRYHEPLDFKVIKSFAETVRAYGINAAFTVTQVEALRRHCLTPSDWSGLVRACLSPGQYLDWRAFLLEFANEQAAVNHAAGNPAWDRDMLLGQGRFVNQQTGYPAEVYEQINDMGIRAWKALPNKGEVSGNLTKILQGSTEPFSDFVARMVEAAGRIFGDPDTAMPLIKQLVFEQCTKECKAAITPYKHKGLEAWMKVCRELGGPLTNAGLAAAVVQLSQRKGGNPGACFKCGKTGHIKRNCPERGGPREAGRNPPGKKPGLCPRCKKGRHWANECRSVKDINGQPLGQAQEGHNPKNGQRGPRPQGPQIYVAVESQDKNSYPERWPTFRHPKDLGEPLRAPQDWTSVRPPDSY